MVAIFENGCHILNSVLIAAKFGFFTFSAVTIDCWLDPVPDKPESIYYDISLKEAYVV